jgi:hypothetical protein
LTLAVCPVTSKKAEAHTKLHKEHSLLVFGISSQMVPTGIVFPCLAVQPRKGGIVVREDADLKSSEYPRLAPGPGHETEVFEREGTAIDMYDNS